MNEKQCYEIINGLRKIQARKYSYEEFFRVLKRRIKIFTGIDEAVFWNELQVCNKLMELGVVKP